MRRHLEFSYASLNQIAAGIGRRRPFNDRLGVIKHICDRIAVVYLGRTVEIESSDCVCRMPRHPHTEALLRAIPIADPRRCGSKIVEPFPQTAIFRLCVKVRDVTRRSDIE